MKLVSTACPRNCYSSCSFRVEVDQNRISGILPQTLNRATPGGPCLKGLSYVERAHSPSRNVQPVLRQQGKFKVITWDQAFDILVEKLNYYRDQFGPHSILFYAASGMSGLLNEISMHFWRMFGGATTVYGNLCWPAGLEATKLTLGANQHNAPWDISHAMLIILWGKNAAETNIHQMVFVEEARRKGAKVVVIDPRYTETAQKADLLIRPRPGTDGALALAIAKVIIENEDHDSAFIKKHVEGFEVFRKSLEMRDLSDWARICDVSENLIRQLADWIAHIKPMTLVPGYGMQRYSNGGQTTRCLLSLSAITGNIGRKGACWHYADLQSYIFDSIKEPDSYYPDPHRDAPFRRSIPTATLGESMLNLKDPPLKMAWVERGNPLSQNPDSNKIRQAFEKLEFRVVIDQFMTDTAQQADLILPAKNMFEQSDIIGSYWHPYVQFKPRVLDPPSGVKAETEIYHTLAMRLGFDAQEIFTKLPAPGDESVRNWLNDRVNQFPSFSIEDMENKPLLPPGYQEIAFANLHFPTPSGKIELYSSKAAEKWGVSPLPEYVALTEGYPGDSKYPLTLLSPNTKNRIHSQFGNLDLIRDLDPGPKVYMHPSDARARDMAEGDIARIFNDRGSIQLPVKLDEGLRPGLIVLYNGYWHSEGGSPNSLSKGRETDMGHGTAFHDNLVQVQKLR